MVAQEAVAAKAMARKGTGGPSPTTPYIAPVVMLRIMGPTVTSVQSAPVPQPSHKANSDTSAAQRSDSGVPRGKGEEATVHVGATAPHNLRSKGGRSLRTCKSLHASTPEDRILRAGPASTRLSPQGGNYWDTVLSREDQRPKP